MNPGYDVRDVAHVLSFASSSHLSSTAQRIAGTRPASLSRLRTIDLIDRFRSGPRAESLAKRWWRRPEVAVEVDRGSRRAAGGATI